MKPGLFLVFPVDSGLLEMIQGLNCVVSPLRQIS